MEAIKNLITELFQSPLSYSVKNWVTAVVIAVLVHQFVL